MKTEKLDVARLIIITVIACACWTTPWIFNRAMGLSGGHWFWSASLRYGWMTLFLHLWIGVTHGFRGIVELWRLFFQYLNFWLVVGGIGYGIFYAVSCYAAPIAPAWVLALTYQFTVIPSAIFLHLLGHQVPWRKLFKFMPIFLLGISLVCFSQAGKSRNIAVAIVAMAVAAICYPFGNRVTGEAQEGGHASIPHIDHPLMRYAPAKVLLLTLGSIPVWTVLFLCLLPTLPSPQPSQFLYTGIVALFAGVIGTSLFLFASHKAQGRSYAVVVVDATQSIEVPFTILGEVLFLHASVPPVIGWIGTFIVIGSLIYAVKNERNL